MTTILSALMDGEFQDAALLDALSRTPLANQLDFPHRADLWGTLDADVCERLVKSTMTAWIERFLTDGGRSRPEARLAEALREDAVMRPILGRLTQNPIRGIDVFHMFSDIEEWRFREWLEQVLWHRSDIGAAAAEQVGRLVALRMWNETAKYLADRALWDRSDLRPAMPFCANQIGRIPRFLLALPGDSKENAKWRLLEEIGADLYPIGAGDHELWGRAGGKHSDIPHAGSGTEGWQIVVRDMEKGRGRIDVHRLIETMYEDFPHNQVLQKIRNEKLFK